MKKTFKNNGLSIVFFILFVLSLVGQFITGWKQDNEDLKEKGAPQLTFSKYLTSGHSIEATFENWESEFLQMALFVILSACLYQKGSSESKDPDKKNPSERKPDPKKKDAPWAVRQGGWIAEIYSHSLSIALVSLFLLSLILHFYGSMKHYNLEQTLKRQPVETAFQYLSNSKFWFESFQNWQSEFLSVLAIVIFSIYFRERSSAQSKAVDAAHSETGD